MAAQPVIIDAALVHRLVAGQFPQYARLPVRLVEPGGWDNRTFRLGDHLSVRLPSAESYKEQVEKEHRWLPRLAPHLPLPIPTPLAIGAPAHGYPWHWSIYRWIDGDTAATGRVADLSQFAVDLARFLTALWRIDPAGGPAPEAHNFWRGGPVATYTDQTRRATVALAGLIDVAAVGQVWEAALRSTWQGPPVWVHGDVAVDNLPVAKGRLHAVIDFGCSAVGDPACDLVIAWTLLSGESREAFRAALGLDEETWARGRGWALWKALITLEKHGERGYEAQRVIDEVIADHRQA